MRWMFRAAVVLALTCSAAQAQVVISQVNGNGGLAGDTYDRDFVELFNRGTTTVDLSGWSLLMFGDSGTSTSPFTPTWTTLPLSGTIQPGQYRLIVPVVIRGGLGSAFSLPPLPPADILAEPGSDRNLSPSANAIALMNAVVTLADGDCPVGHPNLVDFVRYGLANGLCVEGEGLAIAPTNNQRAVQRIDDGCVDTDENSVDLLVGLFPDPRNGVQNRFVTSEMSDLTVTNGAPTPVTVRVSRGLSPCNPLPEGNLSAATADLTAFGLTANETLFDDGAHNDGAANDGVFGLEFTVPGNQAPGRYEILTTGTGNGGGLTLPSTAVLGVFPEPATNDLCSAPIALSGTDPVLFSGFVNTNQASPDEDSGTCNGDTETKFSVWFSYTHPTGGAIRVEENSSEDIVVSIFSSCGGASIVCQRNDTGSYIPMPAGEPMLIQIGQETGSFVAPQVPLDLTIYFEPGAVNDEPCGALPLVDGNQHLTPNAAATAAVESNGLGITCDQGANPPEARRGVWYTYTAPATGATIQFNEESTNFADMSAFTSSDGTCGGVMTQVGCVKESALRRFIHLAPNTTHFILFSLDTFSVIPSVPYDISATITPAPANDEACNATSLTFPMVDSVNAIAATPDSAPSSACTTFTNRFNGVWYTYTTGPTESGAIRLNESSENNVFWNAFTGPDCSSLTPVRCLFSDDAGVPVEPSTTYWFLVSLEDTNATTAGINGTYEIAFEFYEPPANDQPCGATLVTDSLADVVFGPAATADIDSSCNFNIPAQSTTGFGVWYRFLTDEAKLLRVNDAGSDDLVFILYTEDDCNDLMPDDELDCKMGGSIPTDVAYYELSPGVSYYLLVGKIANSLPFGVYDLTIDLLEPHGACCAGQFCTISTEADCEATFAGAFTNCGDTPQYLDFAGAPIPDATSGAGGQPGVLVRTIDIPDSGTVEDIKVMIEMNHARVGDLIITLQSPSFLQQDLIRRIDDTDFGCPNFGQQGRLTDLGGVYIFDDQAVNPYGPTMPPAAKYFDFTGLVVPSGHYQPTTCNDVLVSLNDVFAGTSITGQWTLTISDNQASSTGTLISWGLILNYGSAPTCTCHGDLNESGSADGSDVQPFVDCLVLGVGANCECADFSGNGSAGMEDVEPFVNLLLGE